MQTFLPYSNFAKSAKCLDNKRLGKQRVECYQILKALSNPDYGWQNHPAVQMWRGYENMLTIYGITICNEWINRGFKDTCKAKIESYQCLNGWEIPAFVGNNKFHRSHKSNLLRKNPEYYSKFNWKVPNNLEYVWPKTDDKNNNN